MHLGPYEVSAWLASGPAHQLFSLEDGRLLYRFAPTADAEQRAALRGPIGQLIDVLQADWSACPRPDSESISRGRSGDEWLVVIRDPVGVRTSALRDVLEPSLALGLARAALVGLAPLHRAGLFHGALTPGRLVLTADGRPLVMDGGAAFLAQAAASGRLSPATNRFAELWDQPSFVCPELLTQRPLTPASDVFGVAALAYRWIVGAPAHRARRVLEAYARVRRGDFPRLADVAPQVPRQVAGVLDACLSPDPSDRPHEQDLLSVLEGYATDDLGRLSSDAPTWRAELAAWSSGLPRRRPTDAPGPPGSASEQARQDTIRRATLNLEMRRQPPGDRPTGRRNALLLSLLVAVGVAASLPLLFRPTAAPNSGATLPGNYLEEARRLQGNDPSGEAGDDEVDFDDEEYAESESDEPLLQEPRTEVVTLTVGTRGPAAQRPHVARRTPEREVPRPRAGIEELEPEPVDPTGAEDDPGRRD